MVAFKQKERCTMDLVIMAAGMGSRFGGLKQIEPVNENGEFIIDYSIFDAIRAGFDRVVFIIKEENYKIFHETVGKRIENKIKVAYVFQKLENLPEGYQVPEGRVKPWGTAHAIWCCKDVVKGQFAVINADDFYGKNAFEKAGEFMTNNTEDFGLIAYKVKNTLSENGSAKRGVCKIRNNQLEGITECSVEKKDGKIYASPLDSDCFFEVDENQAVSMNMWCLTPDIFTMLESKFPEFLDENLDSNPLKCEYLLPTVIDEMVEEGLKQVDILKTNSKWLGVTYKEDKQSVVDGLKALTRKGDYPKNLWNEFDKQL